MNKIKKIMVAIVVMTVPMHGTQFLQQLIQPESKQKIFVGIVEEKRKQLEEIQKEKTALATTEKQFEEKIARHINEVRTILTAVETALKSRSDEELLLKKQSLLKESEAVLKDTQRVREDTLSLVEELIRHFNEFLSDTELEGFKKKYKLQERLYYSFEDLQTLHELILDQERLIVQLTDQHKSSLAEKESRKRSVAGLQDEYEKRKHEAQLFSEVARGDLLFGADLEKEKEFVQLELKAYKYKKRLEELRVQELTDRVISVEFRLFIAKTQLDLFKKQLRMVKPSIHVSEADVALAEEAVAKEQQGYFARKDALHQEREKSAAAQKTKEKELAVLSKQLNVPLGRDIDEWSAKPKQSASSYVSLALVGALNDEVLALAKEKDLLDAQTVLEEEKFNYKKTRTEGKKTYNKIAAHGFLTEEEIARERNEYDAKKHDVEEVLKLYQSKMSVVANELNQQKKVIDKIKDLRDEADRQSESVFKGKHKDYAEFSHALDRAETEVRHQIDVLGKLTAIYSGITAEMNSILRLIDFISVELQANTIWYRPAYAITLDGVKNIVTDTKAFLSDVRLYVMQFSVKLFILRVKDAFSHLLHTIIFFLLLLILCMIFVVLKKHEALLSDVFFVRCKKYAGLLRVGSFVIGTVITFINTFRASLFLLASAWLVCWMLADSYLYILLYLFSIPYCAYLSYYFMTMLTELNTTYDYILLPEDYQKRFEIICSSLLFISISIFFFRQGFMLSSVYLRSELPNILLAINFIVLQISLIFLITKEQIVGIIPEQTDFWRWIHVHVDRYYYLILCGVVAIIVMSNPYVGFGRLVLYLLSGLVYTILLAKILLMLHECVKYATSHLFFVQEETMMRERFAYAKTCFGLIIIGSFVILSFVGFIVFAKIWGWEITLIDIKRLLSQPLLLEDTTHPVTTISLLKIILYLLGGITSAYALKQYVFARIFDLLLVESGVQHTVTSIIQYVVIVIAIFIGFKSVGLGELVWWVFTALALSIGLYIKDPISDFVSYFIILVQRPVKIGDYVEIDTETIGVVRKITPRAVVLRRKNSTTIIVPNSYIVSKAIENWNYVRNFIALNDITLLITYKDDPQKVKDILQRAIEDYSHALKNPRPIVRLSNFTEFGYEFMVRVFVSSAYTLEMWDMGSDIRLLIAKAFKENGIQFAIPMYKIEDTHNQFEQKIKEPTPLHDGNKNIRE